MTPFINKLSDWLTRWIGSTESLVLHSVFFVFCFLTHWLFGWSFDIILLILTTLVSLEAIYLAIFIQRSVNQQAIRLEDVEESIDEVEETLEDVEEDLEDIEEGLEDVEKEQKRQKKAKVTPEEQYALLLELKSAIDELRTIKKKP